MEIFVLDSRYMKYLFNTVTLTSDHQNLINLSENLRYPMILCSKDDDQLLKSFLFKTSAQ